MSHEKIHKQNMAKGVDYLSSKKNIQFFTSKRCASLSKNQQQKNLQFLYLLAAGGQTPPPINGLFR